MTLPLACATRRATALPMAAKTAILILWTGRHTIAASNFWPRRWKKLRSEIKRSLKSSSDSRPGGEGRLLRPDKSGLAMTGGSREGKCTSHRHNHGEVILPTRYNGEVGNG